VSPARLTLYDLLAMESIRVAPLSVVLVVVGSVIALGARLVATHERRFTVWWASQLARPRILAIRRRYRKGQQELSAKVDPTGVLGIYLIGSLLAICGLVTAAGAAARILFSRRELISLAPFVAQFMASNRTPRLIFAMKLFSWLGEPRVVGGLTAIAALLLIRRSRSIKPALFLVVLVLAGQLLKLAVQHLAEGELGTPGGSYGNPAAFPSGHAVAAVTLYGGIAYLIARLSRTWKVKTWCWAAAIAAILAVGVSQIYSGTNSVFDVAGGFVLGVVLLALASAGMVAWEEMERFDRLKRARKTLVGHALKWGFVAVSMGILIHVVLLALPGLKKSAAALNHLHPAWVLVAVILEVGSNLTLAELYRQTLLELGGPAITYKKALVVSMGGFTVGRVLPGGGATAGVFMARGLTALEVPAAAATSSVLIGGLLGMAVLGIIVAVGALTTLFRGELPTGYLIGIPLASGGLAGFLVLVVKILRSEGVRNRVFGSVERLIGAFRVRVDLTVARGFVEEVAQALPDLRKLAVPAMWSAANWLLDALALWVLFFGFGYRMHIGILLIGYGVANLVNGLPITPGGLGLVEAGLAGVYVAFGVPSGVAVVTVLAYRLVSFWLPVAAGVPAYLKGAGRKPRSFDKIEEVAQEVGS
jgi:uncharacterized protein (TIRG00374 family)